jgi:predicted AAA+ superfamily ATPase
MYNGYNIVIREYFLSELEKLKGEHIIKVIRGLRRSGKSTLLEIFSEKLKESGVADNCIQHYNFACFKYLSKATPF